VEDVAEFWERCELDKKF